GVLKPRGWGGGGQRPPRRGDEDVPGAVVPLDQGPPLGHGAGGHKGDLVAVPERPPGHEEPDDPDGPPVEEWGVADDDDLPRPVVRHNADEDGLNGVRHRNPPATERLVTTRDCQLGFFPAPQACGLTPPAPHSRLARGCQRKSRTAPASRSSTGRPRTPNRT